MTNEDNDPHFVLRIMDGEITLHELDLDNSQFVLYPDQSRISLNLSGNDLAAIRELAPVVERTIEGPAAPQPDITLMAVIENVVRADFMSWSVYGGYTDTVKRSEWMRMRSIEIDKFCRRYRALLDAIKESQP